MRARTWAGLAWFAATTVVLRRDDPIIGSVIVTDRCNLACQHCAVANLRRVDYSFPRVHADMVGLHARGVRALLLYGGEPFLWHDGNRGLADLVAEARAIGFPLVSVVTNGTRGLDLPGADLLLVSLDGTPAHHDELRGRGTYDRVMTSIRAAPRDNLALYMAVNRVNVDDVEQVAELAARLPTVRAIAFNLHTPYPGTEHLSLGPEQRHDVLVRIAQLKAQGVPVLDLVSAFPFMERQPGSPCPQCLIVEDGQTWACGRCSEIPGLCAQCGFLFAGELTQLFRGRPRVVAEAVRTYTRL